MREGRERLERIGERESFRMDGRLGIRMGRSGNAQV